MKAVFGLGNPGKEYADTPHNAGFSVIDRLAGDLSCTFRRSFRFKSCIGKAVYEGENLLLVKPQTFMNLSGRAVASIKRYRKLSLSDVIVVVDDADLDLGRLRIRTSGSSGGHKGLDSVIQHFGDGEFTRIRLGIGRDEREEGLVDHVLSPFAPGEREKADGMIQHASEAVLCILTEGVDVAMNKFNGPLVDVEGTET